MYGLVGHCNHLGGSYCVQLQGRSATMAVLMILADLLETLVTKWETMRQYIPEAVEKSSHVLTFCHIYEGDMNAFNQFYLLFISGPSSLQETDTVCGFLVNSESNLVSPWHVISTLESKIDNRIRQTQKRLSIFQVPQFCFLSVAQKENCSNFTKYFDSVCSCSDITG
jgi:hypothetical protein